MNAQVRLLGTESSIITFQIEDIFKKFFSNLLFFPILIETKNFLPDRSSNITIRKKPVNKKGLILFKLYYLSREIELISILK